MKKSIEEQIEQVIALENVSAIGFSNALFSLGGLFNDLVKQVGDRQAVAQSDLFRRANSRLSTLLDREAEAMRANRQVPTASANGVATRSETPNHTAAHS